MLIDLIIFIVSMYFLIKSANYFVESSSAIAKKLGVSELTIGLTIVSLGTSLPELGAAVSAALVKNYDIVFGDIIGSNIANIALVFGVAIVISGKIVNNAGNFKRTSFYMLLTTILFSFIAVIGVMPYQAGLLFLALFGLFIYSLKIQKKLLKQETSELHLNVAKKEPYKKELVIFFASILVIFLSSKYLISSATGIAEFFGISDMVIAVFAIAIGTSSPELAVTISSLKKGKFDLLVGNVIGSNMANLLLVGGISSLITPLIISKPVLYLLTPILIITTFIMFMMVRTKKPITRKHGVALLVLYFSFIIASFVFQ